MPPMSEDNDTYTDEAELNNTKKRARDAKDAPTGKSRRREKPPLAPVKWDDNMTETLWTLIRENPDLKPVLINEPPRHLQPSGNGIIIFSKKDLQRRIALTLFKDGAFNLQDPAILDSLTRAVKNKLHKTQMLYDQVLSDFPPEFRNMRTERDVPRHLLPQWDKLREKFPTFLPYHLLMLEQPALIEELKQRAADINGYREWSAGPSTPNSASLTGRSNSNDNSRRRSLSGGPVGCSDEPCQHTRDQINFEVRPPPVNQLNAGPYSDFEQSPYSKFGASLTGSSRSPSRSPTSQSGPPHMLARNDHVVATRTWTSPEAPTTLSGTADQLISDGVQTFSSPFHHSSLELTTSNLPGISPMAVPVGDFGAFQAQFAPPMDNGQQRRFMNNFRPSLNVPAAQRRSRLNNQPMSARSLDDSELHQQNRSHRPHERSHSASSLTPSADAPPESHLSGERSTPGKWDEDSPSDESLARDRDSPPIANAIESIMQLVREKESRKRQREEEWVRVKRLKLEDRERQRQENEKQRLENERQRQHDSRMMEMRLELARLEANNASTNAAAVLLSAQQLPIPLPSSASTLASPQSAENPSLHGVDLEFVNDLNQLSSPAGVALRNGSAGSDALYLHGHHIASPPAPMIPQPGNFIQSPTSMLPGAPTHAFHAHPQLPPPQQQQQQQESSQPPTNQMLSPEQQAYVGLYPSSFGF